MGIGASKPVDLTLYAKKADLPPPVNLSDYMRKSDVPDVSVFARKTELPDLSPYARAEDVQVWIQPYVRSEDWQKTLGTLATTEQVKSTVSELASKEQVKSWLLPFQVDKNPFAKSAYQNQYKEYPNFNMAGSDLWGKDNVTHDDCRKFCEGTSRCAGYVFGKADKSGTAMCWPKRIQPNDNVIETGVKFDDGFLTYSYADFPGNDIPGGAIQNTTAQACAEACRNNPRCSHYAYIMPNTCVMKNVTPEIAPNTNITAFRR